MKLQFEYDEEKDVMTIEGMKYSGDFFRIFLSEGLDIGESFVLAKQEDGIITFERKRDDL